MPELEWTPVSKNSMKELSRALHCTWQGHESMAEDQTAGPSIEGLVHQPEN